MVPYRGLDGDFAEGSTPFGNPHSHLGRLEILHCFNGSPDPEIGDVEAVTTILLSLILTLIRTADTQFVFDVANIGVDVQSCLMFLSNKLEGLVGPRWESGEHPVFTAIYASELSRRGTEMFPALLSSSVEYRSESR